MKSSVSAGRRRLVPISLALLTLLVLLTAACGGDKGDDTAALPDTIETLAPETLAPAPLPSPEPSPVILYPAAAVPNYADYTSAARIASALAEENTYAFAVDGTHYYNRGVLTEGGADVLRRGKDGSLSVNGKAIGALLGRDCTDGAPAEVARALGLEVAVYDGKSVLFYENTLPLHTYEDIYTYEAMYLYMTGAGDTELLNAFIDLPDRISNGTSNTVYYTASDLHLGVQTSVYYAQMGDTAGVLNGPALVAGEGQHEDNFTTVRIFNSQQTCIAQFLAFPASVTGGVQVAAAAVGDETLIATAPFALPDREMGDVRVFDSFGLRRMVIGIRDTVPGPHTILTGRFSTATEDEVLLIASSSTDEEGALSLALLSLADGTLLATHTLDCGFALGDEGASVPVNLSARRGESGDTLILHFPTVQAVYEGTVEDAVFENAGITLPADAVSVAASSVEGARYMVSLPAREDSPNQSFMVLYGEDEADGTLTDVGFRENRFFSAFYTSGFSDDKYVTRGDFCHIRTDLYNNVLMQVPAGSAAVDSYFDGISYSGYSCWEGDNYANRLATDYLFLEPCFTHRWNKIPATANLASYTDPVTGNQRYVSVGRDGQYTDYNELGSAYYVGTYADGILDLAKLRLFPLRSFLQATASAFRGENGNPEHLVGMSPVHEHEINVPGSVGDYNDAMIEGFRESMLARYGSIENINRLFGTSFDTADAMDPPRDLGRGDWDAYSGDYFIEWSMYNRYIVSKRIMEAYREALLAGYPPEAISAHQIPEGEAVSGFLGQADTRLTPVDTVLTCGTAYGGTRYGFFLNDSQNLIRFAQRLGHYSTTLGEYSAVTVSGTDAFHQLKDLWRRGVRMVHHVSIGNPSFEAADAESIRRLEAENMPRPGYTGGTYGAIGVRQGDGGYSIVQIGAGADTRSVGLLKSVDAEGKWEGTVYLVPFHTKMKAEDITAIQTPVEGRDDRFSTGVLRTLKNTDQVEITLLAAAKTKGATVTFEVYHEGCRLDRATTTYTLTDTLTPYRFVLSNQLYEDGLEVVVTFSSPDGMDGISCEELTATLQTQMADFLYYNRRNAMRNCLPHVGGVTFDILDRDRKY